MTKKLCNNLCILELLYKLYPYLIIKFDDTNQIWVMVPCKIRSQSNGSRTCCVTNKPKYIYIGNHSSSPVCKLLFDNLLYPRPNGPHINQRKPGYLPSFTFKFRIKCFLVLLCFHVLPFMVDVSLLHLKPSFFVTYSGGVSIYKYK